MVLGTSQTTAGQACSVVELRAARIPIIGALAHHYWFVIQTPGTRDRWEVWQHPDAGGKSWGHLHENLMPFHRGVGNGPSWVVRRWRADEAEALRRRIEGSPACYPFCRRYRIWPGPNSNTYVQWVLGTEFRLGWKGWGRGYRPILRQ